MLCTWFPLVKTWHTAYCNSPDCSDDRAPEGAVAEAKHGDRLHGVAEHLVVKGVEDRGQGDRHDPGAQFSKKSLPQSEMEP